MDIFGLGKIGSTAVIAIVAAGVAFGAYKIWEDRVGDQREAEIKARAIEKRLEHVTDSKARQILLERLPRFAKIWCSVDGAGTACCAADAVKLPKCTHDPSGDGRPD